MISIIVNFYNNRREAQNTLYSLTRAYQKDSKDVSYEVIAVDNGSTQPLAEEEVQSFGPEFRYEYVSTTSKSPAQAINSACRDATGDELVIVIDGAHILSPRILKGCVDAFTLFPSPIIATVPFHLGPKPQNLSVLEGYNQSVEDQLLEKSHWKSNGYKLFNISGSFADGAFAGGSGGWFGRLFESNCFGLKKADYLSLGGLDERFQSRGGGLVNLDFFTRALSTDKLQYVMLLGEGTFHQFHGGVASNAALTQHPWKEFLQEYKAIVGGDYNPVLKKPYQLGFLPNEAQHIARISADFAAKFWQ